METKTKLLMTFKDSGGKRVSLAVDAPRADISEEEIRDTMALIVEKDIFSPGGEKLETMVEAKIVATDTTEYDLIF